MPNPKPLAEAELPEVPKCCRAHYYNYVAKPRWYLRANIDDAWATMRIEDIDRLRAMASWRERANGIEPQKSETIAQGPARCGTCKHSGAIKCNHPFGPKVYPDDGSGYCHLHPQNQPKEPPHG